MVFLAQALTAHGYERQGCEAYSGTRGRYRVILGGTIN